MKTTIKRKKVAVGFSDMEKAVAQIVAENLGFSDFGRFMRFCVLAVQTLEQATETRKSVVQFAWEFRTAENVRGSALAPAEEATK